MSRAQHCTCPMLGGGDLPHDDVTLFAGQRSLGASAPITSPGCSPDLYSLPLSYPPPCPAHPPNPVIQTVLS